MNITIYGATGNAGTTITAEALRRGHTVTAVARKATDLPDQPGVTKINDDLSDTAKVAAIIKGSDAVVSAYAPPPTDTDQLLAATARLTEAIAQTNATRLFVVGGAGSLFVAPGVTLEASGYLPEAYMAISHSHLLTLEALRKSSIDWTYFSPAAFFVRGERTGTFRLGLDDLITGADGQSRITYEDYAIATLDELENPKHNRQRFTIGY